MIDFKPIKQTRLSEAVTDQLKHSILRGDFEPGTKLPAERVLAEQFQVSRLSVREALNRLEILGFVALFPTAESPLLTSGNSTGARDRAIVAIRKR